MSGFGWLDLVLALLLVGYAVTGYRQGMVVSIFSLAGFLGGGAVAMGVLPALVQHWGTLERTPLLRAVVLVVGVFVLASVGQALAVGAGRRMRSRVVRGPVRGLDSVLGALVVAVSAAVLIWFVAGAVRGGTPGPIARAVGQSRILRTIDGLVPPQTSRLFAGFRQLLDREGFPRVFEGIRAEPIRPVSPPSPAAVGTAGIAAAGDSVVKITGVAEACNRGQEGSGWVVSRDRVVTNAHVVAGLRQATLRLHGTGRSYLGRVVVFDPERDLAVLAVPGLPARPLPLGGPLRSGASAVVAGFPLDGPYQLEAARIRQLIAARGSDIYGRPGTERDVYSLYARVRPGNSGGPLLDTRGRVVGVIFAKSLDDPVTGYALTLQETEPVLAAASSARTPVDTGACVQG